jgi:hypothetical protein
MSFRIKEQTPGLLHFAAINIFAFASLSVYLIANNIEINDNLLFGSLDSQEYLRAGIDLWNGTFSEAASRRPLLYPIFLLLTYGAGGAKAICFIQAIAWLISANLLASSAYVVTGKKTYYLLGGFGFLINFSIMSMVMQALTEVITILLLSIMVFFVAKNFHKRRRPGFIIVLVFLFSILAVIRPVFIHIVTLSVLVSLFFYHEAFRKKPLYLLVLLMSLSPVIAQVSIMKQQYNMFGVSRISDDTLRLYLVTKALHDEHHEAYDSAAYQQCMKVAAGMTKKEIFNHVSENPGLYVTQFRKNLIDNIRASSSFLLPQSVFRRIMKHINNGYFVTHFAALLALTFLVVRIRRLGISKLLLPVVFLVPGWYIILTSGISFWQGDRLILPAWPLCLMAYLILINELVGLTNEHAPAVARQ